MLSPPLFRSLGCFLVAGLLLAMGSLEPETRWIVSMPPAGICGMGIETEAQARRASLTAAASMIDTVLRDPRFVADYLNHDPAAPAVELLDLEVKPLRYIDDDHIELSVSCLRTTATKAPALPDRLTQACAIYLMDWRDAQVSETIAALRPQLTAAESQTDAASVALAANLRRSLAALETEPLRPPIDASRFPLFSADE